MKTLNRHEHLFECFDPPGCGAMFSADWREDLDVVTCPCGVHWETSSDYEGTGKGGPYVVCAVLIPDPVGEGRLAGTAHPYVAGPRAPEVG